MNRTLIAKAWSRIGVVFYNFFATHLPSHGVRLAVLRFWGAKIGQGTSVFRGTTILDIHMLTLGDNVGIGFRCMLDARGGLTIGNNVVVASDVHFITGGHELDSDDFASFYLPISVGDHAWIASRATVLPGVTIGRGAVVGANSLVRKDVGGMEIVAGIPAKLRGMRESDLSYNPSYRPIFF
jgi:putative colanic acid biosynthesis acetyltransferase WcaF